LTTLYTRIVANEKIQNVPESLKCALCNEKSYRNSDVELYETRKPYEDYQGKINYEENYFCEYLCVNGHRTNAIVELRE